MSTEANNRFFKDFLVWNDCSQLYTKEAGFNRRLLYQVDYKNLKLEELKKMKSIVSSERGEVDDLWIDNNNGVVFSSAENYLNWPHEFSFLNSKEGFVKNPLNGMHFVRNKYGYLFNRPFTYNTELITDLPKYEYSKYKGKKILILGAGPSLSERFSSVDLGSYDFIWSCTKFFLNKYIKKVDLDMFSIGGNVDLSDPELLEYLDTARSPSTRWGIDAFVQPFKTKDELLLFKKKYPDGFVFYTRYFSKLGAGPRLLALAAVLEASQVDFLGIDGHPLGHKHSFEDNKEYKTVEKDGVAEAPTQKGSEDIYRRQFCLLWQYLLTFPDTCFNNLGQGHSGNQSSDIFAAKVT